MRFCKTKVLLFVLFIVALMYSPVYSYEIDTSKTYYIQSAQEYGRGMRGIWDVPGNPRRFQNGQNIKVWELPSHDRRSFDRAFRFHKIRNGVYEISNMLSYSSRLDVDGAGTRNGTNIKLWSRNNNRYSQRYRVSYRGNGRWKFYTMRGQVVCLASRSSRNGSNVHIWQNHNGPWTEWVLIPRMSYRAYMPRKNVRRPVANYRINGLTANIVYTDPYYSKAMRVGNLLRQRGMRIKYTRTNSNSYQGKLLYKAGYLNQARTIQNLIRGYVRLTPQMGRTNSYRDKQFNIWVTGNSYTRPVANVRINGLTANIVYTDQFYNKAMRVGNLLRQRGMRIKYTRTSNSNANNYAGKLLYKNGYHNQARSIQNLIRGQVRLTPQMGRTNSYRDKQFNIWITRW